LPVAEDIARKGINLPSGSALTPAEVDAVCDAIIERARR
jgi:dTDP-4-amino-4,6-dideoxygalactose transaminase